MKNRKSVLLLLVTLCGANFIYAQRTPTKTTPSSDVIMKPRISLPIVNKKDSMVFDKYEGYSKADTVLIDTYKKDTISDKSIARIQEDTLISEAMTFSYNEVGLNTPSYITYAGNIVTISCINISTINIVSVNNAALFFMSTGAKCDFDISSLPSGYFYVVVYDTVTHETTTGGFSKL